MGKLKKVDNTDKNSERNSTIVRGRLVPFLLGGWREYLGLVCVCVKTRSLFAPLHHNAFV